MEKSIVVVGVFPAPNHVRDVRFLAIDRGSWIEIIAGLGRHDEVWETYCRARGLDPCARMNLYEAGAWYDGLCAWGLDPSRYFQAVEMNRERRRMLQKRLNDSAGSLAECKRYQ